MDTLGIRAQQSEAPNRRGFARRLGYPAALLCFIGLFGCTIHNIASTPAPNVLVREQIRGKATITIEGLDDGEMCTQTPGLREFCVTRTKSAFAEGFAGLLPAFFQGEGTNYKGTFRFLGMQLVYASSPSLSRRPAVLVSMKWQFVLDDSDGTHVVQLAETTQSKNPIVNVKQSDQGIREVMEAILEQIAASMNSMRRAPTSR